MLGFVYWSKKISSGKWEVYTNNGREKTGLDVVEWAKSAVSLGAGEILLTSVDKEGTTKGFDLDLVKTVKNNISIPVIASGGMGKTLDLIEVIKKCDVDAVAMAHVLHRNVLTISKIKNFLSSNDINVRKS